jgi:hypothetical protein
MSKNNDKDSTLTRREQVHNHLDVLFKNEQPFTIRSIQECLPHIRSFSSINTFINEWKEINKEAYDFRNRQFDMSSALKRQLNKEVALFVSEQQALLNKSLIESKKETDVAVKEIQRTELENTELNNKLTQAQETIQALTSKIVAIESQYTHKIQSQNELFETQTRKLDEQLQNYVGTNKNLNDELKVTLQSRARLEVKLELCKEESQQNKQTLEKSMATIDSLQTSNNAQANKLELISEKLSSEVKIRESMEQNLARIPLLEKSLLELPVLKEKTVKQEQDIGQLRIQIDSQNAQIDDNKLNKIADEDQISKLRATVEKQQSECTDLATNNKSLIKQNKINQQSIVTLNKSLSTMEQLQNDDAISKESIDENDDALIDAYNSVQNENDKLKTKDLEQTTIIQEQAKLIAKLNLKISS